MKYKKYKFNSQANCRVCQTQSLGLMTEFNAILETNYSSDLSILTALEFVMSRKIIENSEIPNTICSMCVKLLKISYEFIQQFNKSEEKLRIELQGKVDDQELGNLQNLENEQIPVEVVIGSQKFNIKDLLIVEEEKQCNDEFEGFLNNLGKTISATYVKKNCKNQLLTRPNLKKPDVVIEKVTNSRNLNEKLYHYPEERFEANKENPQYIGEDANNLLMQPLDEQNKTTAITENDEFNELNAEQPFTCCFCKETFSFMEGLQHNETCAVKGDKLTCFLCLKSFVTKKRLLNHMNIIHFNIKKSPLSTQQGKYECYMCHKICSSYGSLAYHVAKHQGRQFHCDICKQSFYTKYEVTMHKQSHNRNKTITICPICGKRFHYQSGLFYHMKTHTNERNYVCRFCPKRFYTRHSIKRHELIHTGIRPYSCDDCNKKFRSLSEKKKHESVHAGERPYSCKCCEMSFTQLHNLKVHLLIHEGDVRCNFCARGFVDSDTLKLHTKKKHPLIVLKDGKKNVGEEIDKNQMTITDDVIEATLDDDTASSMLENNFLMEEQDEYEKGDADETYGVLIKENILLGSFFR